MALFSKPRDNASGAVSKTTLPPFHPSTIVCDFGKAGTFDLESMKSGIIGFGSTGSGKTSSFAKALFTGFARCHFGMVCLCAKADEASMLRRWAEAEGRACDIIEITAAGEYGYNFLEEAARMSGGAGLTLNIVSLLMEVAGALRSGGGKEEEDGGDKFWTDALRFLLTNLIDLCILSRQPVTLPRLRELASSAPLTPEQAASDAFRKKSECCKAIVEAITLAGEDAFALVNVKECAAFFLQTWPNLASKTRSIISFQLDFLIRPFLTMPLYKILSTQTNFRPEDVFDGKIIIVNLPSQIYKETGIFIGILMKYLTQLAVMRRAEPKNGTYLRPVVIYSDECQNFISDFDYIYQSVARASAGITFYIVQNRETLIAKLGNTYKVDSLLANLQNKFLCQNTGETNEWAAKLLGERWIEIASTSVNRSGHDVSTNSGVSIGQELRAYVESSRFATLKRGGLAHDFLVETIFFKGGHRFSDGLPFRLLTFDQR